MCVLQKVQYYMFKTDTRCILQKVLYVEFFKLQFVSIKNAMLSVLTKKQDEFEKGTQ